MHAIWTGTASRGSGTEVAHKLSDKILCRHDKGKEEAMVWFFSPRRDGDGLQKAKVATFTAARIWVGSN